MKYYHSMDIAKLICAIFVVLIHTTAYIPANEIDTFYNYHVYRPFLNIAVPFFFAASGFFLASRTNDYILGYSKKILFYYITFSVLYMVFKIVLILLDKLVFGVPFWTSLDRLIDGWNLGNVLNGTIGSYHLWFLSALLFSSLLLVLFIKFNINSSTILLISLFLFLLYMGGFINVGNLFAYGGVAKGFLYLSMGYFLGQSKIRIERPTLWFIFSFIMYYIFHHLLKADVDEILLIMSTFYFLLLCVNRPGEQSYLSNLGRKSLGIYILHIMVIELSVRIYKYLGITSYDDISFYLITTALAVIIPLFVFDFINILLNRIFRTPFNHFFDNH